MIFSSEILNGIENDLTNFRSGKMVCLIALCCASLKKFGLKIRVYEELVNTEITKFKSLQFLNDRERMKPIKNDDA